MLEVSRCGFDSEDLCTSREEGVSFLWLTHLGLLGVALNKETVFTDASLCPKLAPRDNQQNLFERQIILRSMWSLVSNKTVAAGGLLLGNLYFEPFDFYTCSSGPSIQCIQAYDWEDLFAAKVLIPQTKLSYVVVYQVPSFGRDTLFHLTYTPTATTTSLSRYNASDLLPRP